MILTAIGIKLGANPEEGTVPSSRSLSKELATSRVLGGRKLRVGKKKKSERPRMNKS